MIYSLGWCTWAANNRTLRRMLLPLFRRINVGDITVRHHWTGDRMVVHSFVHKGFWFKGRKREYDTMAAFQRLLKGGDTVIDVGAHIGYTALLFGNLVGPSGHVYAFEPGPNNLPYTRKNCSNCRYRNISVIEMAASNSEGNAPFYVEPMTGLNNSLLLDYAVRTPNWRSYGCRPEPAPSLVQTIRLDSYVQQHHLRPTFVKIDVEGAEAAVLEGAVNTLSLSRPVLMVEVTRRHSDVTRILFEHSYRFFAPTGAAIGESQLKSGHVPIPVNVFAIPVENREAIGRFLNSQASLSDVVTRTGETIGLYRAEP